MAISSGQAGTGTMVIGHVRPDQNNGPWVMLMLMGLEPYDHVFPRNLICLVNARMWVVLFVCLFD